MKQSVLQSFEAKYMRPKPLPHFKAGDSVSVWVKIQEGFEKDNTPKFRLQPFEGVVLRFRKGTTNSTFLVRKMSGAIGVERNFFVHSPLIDHVNVTVYGKVRRSRIYYIRKLRGKAARISTRYVSAAELQET